MSWLSITSIKKAVIKDTPKLPYIDSNYVNVFVIDSVLWYTSATVGNNLQRAGLRIHLRSSSSNCSESIYFRLNPQIMRYYFKLRLIFFSLLGGKFIKFFSLSTNKRISSRTSIFFDWNSVWRSRRSELCHWRERSRCGYNSGS